MHYYMVLPLLLLLGGKHFIQDRLENHGIMGVLFFRMPPVQNQKPWHYGSTIVHNAPCLETMALWEYCFS